jgi:hypothetical protein
MTPYFWSPIDHFVIFTIYHSRGALKVESFGVGNKKFILDGVNCTGKESKLEDCAHKAWGNTSCKGGETQAAGVVCTPEKSKFTRRDRYQFLYSPCHLLQNDVWFTARDSTGIDDLMAFRSWSNFRSESSPNTLKSLQYHSIITDGSTSWIEVQTATLIVRTELVGF